MKEIMHFIYKLILYLSIVNPIQSIGVSYNLIKQGGLDIFGYYMLLRMDLEIRN